MNFSEIKGHENIKRAIEIAILGKHKLALKVVNGHGATMLAEASEHIAKQSMNSAFFITEFPEGEPITKIQSSAFDIVIEMTPITPEIFLSNRKSESSENVIYRITDAQNYPIVDSLISADSVTLLKSAMKRLQLSPKQGSNIINVARTIARLDKDKEIKAHHIAEAINYQNFRND